MALLIFDTDMPVHFVRFQLTFCHEAAATHIAKERLFTRVDSQMVVQLCLASKRFGTGGAWEGSHLHVCLAVVLQC